MLLAYFIGKYDQSLHWVKRITTKCSGHHGTAFRVWALWHKGKPALQMGGAVPYMQYTHKFLHRDVLCFLLYKQDPSDPNTTHSFSPMVHQMHMHVQRPPVQ